MLTLHTRAYCPSPKPPSLAASHCIEDVESAGVDPDGVPRIRFKAGRSVGKAAQNGQLLLQRQAQLLRLVRCKSAAATETSTSIRSRRLRRATQRAAAVRPRFGAGPRPQRAHAAQGQLGPGGAALARWGLTSVTQKCRMMVGRWASFALPSEDPMPVSRTDTLLQHTQQVLEARGSGGGPARCRHGRHVLCARPCRTRTAALQRWSGPRRLTLAAFSRSCSQWWPGHAFQAAQRRGHALDGQLCRGPKPHSNDSMYLTPKPQRHPPKAVEAFHPRFQSIAAGPGLGGCGEGRHLFCKSPGSVPRRVRILYPRQLPTVL